MHTAAAYRRSPFPQRIEQNIALQLAVYSTLLSVGTRALVGRPWALNTKEWWRGYPNQPLECDLNSAYCHQIATGILSTTKSDIIEASSKHIYLQGRCGAVL